MTQDQSQYVIPNPRGLWVRDPCSENPFSSERGELVITAGFLVAQDAPRSQEVILGNMTQDQSQYVIPNPRGLWVRDPCSENPFSSRQGEWIIVTGISRKEHSK